SSVRVTLAKARSREGYRPVGIGLRRGSGARAGCKTHRQKSPRTNASPVRICVNAADRMAASFDMDGDVRPISEVRSLTLGHKSLLACYLVKVLKLLERVKGIEPSS